MFTNKYTKLVTAMGLALSAGVAQAAITDVVPNGDFETGDLTGWLSFANGGAVSIANENSTLGPAGSYSAKLSADASSGTSFPIIKVERLAEGFLTDGGEVTVTYDAKATLQTVDFPNIAGKVVFISEFFTEKTGDNGAINNILQQAPDFLNDTWTRYSYTFNMAADAGGGLSMLFKADCGASPNCRLDALIDNVSITTDVSAVPVPAAVWLFGSGLLGLVGVARRKKALAA